MISAPTVGNGFIRSVWGAVWRVVEGADPYGSHKLKLFGKADDPVGFGEAAAQVKGKALGVI